jgi:hypothetical protein
MPQSNRPIIEFKAGPVHASIWPERIKRDGRSWDSFSIQIQKIFWDPTDGQHRTTSYFRPDELPKLVLVANEAFAYVTLKQQKSTGENADDGASNRAAAEQPKKDAP